MLTKKTFYTVFLSIAFIKICFFVAFVELRNPNTYPDFIINHWALKSNDSETYYWTLYNFSTTFQYIGACRMPGLGVVYLPPRLFLSHENSLVFVVFTQLVFEIIASLLCCIMALKLFQSKRAFWFTAFAVGLSAFVSVRANYLLSDSLCSSALIMSTWFLLKWRENKKLSPLIAASLLFTWAIFLRQICIVIIPIFAAIVFFSNQYNSKLKLKHTLIFFLPLVLSLSLWNIRNRVVLNRNILLVAPLQECMGQLKPEFLAVRKLMITMGQDAQPWAVGNAHNWFMNAENSSACPISRYHYCDSLTQQSIEKLKWTYWSFSDKGESDSIQAVKSEFIRTCQDFERLYIKERWYLYYGFNRISFLFQFLFPTRLDDFPFPKMSEAAPAAISIKVSSYLLLLIVNLLFLVSFSVQLYRRDFNQILLSLLGMAPILVLAYLGYIEQRYLATSFYFLILGSAYLFRGKRIESGIII